MNKKRRIPFGVWLGLSCPAIFAIQVVAYMNIVDRTVGAFPLSKRLNWMGAEEVPAKAAVLKSKFSSVRSQRPEDYYDLAFFWQHQLKAETIEFTVIDDAQLAKGLGKAYSVLILPWTVCMSDEQRRAVREFVRAGNGLVASGAVGARNADCSWHGWDFAQEITGLDDFQSITPETGSFAGFRGGQFYSGGVPAGLRLDLPLQEITYGWSDNPDAYWSDPRSRPKEGTLPQEVSLAVHTEWGAGRVVWMGFNERMTGAKEPSLTKFRDNYARSAIRWVSRQPMIVVGEWPNRMPSAAIVAADAGDDAPAATRLAAMFASLRAPATLFVSPGGAPKPEDLKNSPWTEVAAAHDPESLVTDRNVLNQVQALTDSRQTLEAHLKRPVAGYKPPQDFWTIDTLVALRTSGYGYFLDRTGNHRSAPEIVEFPSTTWFGSKVEVMKVASGWADELETIAAYEGPSPWQEDMGDSFVRDADLNGYVGGAYVFNFSTRLLGSEANEHIVRSVISRLQHKPVWLTTGAWARSWWSAREKVRVEARQLHQHRIRVSVVNRGRFTMDNVNVYLHLPYRPDKVRLISEFIGKTPPSSELVPGADVLRLDFPKLEKESSHVFLVALDE